MDCVTVILNPSSGLAYRRPDPARVGQIFRERGLSVRVLSLDRLDAIASAARQAAANRERVVIAAGGDGTVSAVASTLVKTNTALGVLPVGTFNHFARDMQIPLDLAGAAEVIARGKVDWVDVGSVNGRIFVNNSSIGIYPNIVLLREFGRRRGRSKWTAFARATFAMLRRFSFLAVRVEAGGEAVVAQTPFVFVGNNEYEIRGLEIGRRSSLAEGRLFLYVPAPISRLGLIWMALNAVFGRLDPGRTLAMREIEEAWITTRKKRLRVSTDGEIAVLRSPLHYRSLPRALKVFVP